MVDMKLSLHIFISLLYLLLSSSCKLNIKQSISDAKIENSSKIVKEVNASPWIEEAQIAFNHDHLHGDKNLTFKVISSPGEISATDSSSPISVSGLTPGISYTFIVVTIDTTTGKTYSSAPSNSVTPYSNVTPDPPVAVSAIAGKRSAEVFFTPVPSNGGPPGGDFIVTSIPEGITSYGNTSPILIEGLTPGVSYTFTVEESNKVGTSNPSVSSNAIVPDPGNAPSQPTNVIASGASGGILVSFDSPLDTGDSPITSYTVTSSPGGITASGASSPITVTGLSSGTQYTFTVTATNADGESSPSQASASIWYLNFMPPGAPTGVTATAGPANASVAFTPPADAGSGVIYYSVLSEPGGIEQTGASSPITVTGLTAGVSYTFTVRASGIGGSGPFSLPSNAISPTPPPPGKTIIKTATARALAADVEFEPPTSGGPGIVGYQVESIPGGVQANGANSPIRVNGLTAGVNYTFRVRAYSVNGYGEFSDESNSVKVLSDVTAPDAPTMGFALAGDGSATIIFDEPENDGGSPILYYLVLASNGLMATGNSSPIIMNNLTPGQVYNFRVIAINMVGQSNLSAVSNDIIPTMSAPGTPTIDSVTSGPLSATITFTAPSANGGSPIISYTVISTPDNITVTSSSSPITVPGLTPGESYTFQVYATNAAGDSDLSSPSDSVYPTSVNPFISVWETFDEDQAISLPLVDGYAYNFVVDWGDGKPPGVITSWDDPDSHHIYEEPGQYTMTISGLVQSWRLYGKPSAEFLVEVTNLGDMGWRNLAYAFGDCYNLRRFAGGNVSQVESMEGMFVNVSAMESLDLSSFDTSNVSNMSHMFNGFSSSQNVIDLSHFNLSSLTHASNMFNGSYVNSLIMSGWSAPNLSSIDDMFSYSTFSNLNISNFSAPSLTDMTRMFSDMQISNSFDLTSFDTSEVIHMNHMFSGLYAPVAQLDLSSFNTSKVQSMDGMFENASINQLDLSGFETGNIRTMVGMFRNFDYGTNTLDLSHFDTQNVRSTEEMFFGATFGHLILSTWSNSNLLDMQLMFGQATIISLNLNNFSTPNVLNMYGLFESASINNLNLSSFNTSTVLYLNRMFAGSSIGAVNIGNWDVTHGPTADEIFEDSFPFMILYCNQPSGMFFGKTCQ